MANPTRPLKPQSLRAQTSPHHQSTQGAATWRVLGGFLAGVMMTAAALWIAFGMSMQHQFAALTKHNIALTRANTEVQRQLEASKDDIHMFKESRQALAVQNTLLSQENRQYESKQRELLVQLLRTRIYVVVEQLRGNLVIPIGVRSSDTMAIHRVFTIHHQMENGFNKKNWQAVIARVQEQLRGYKRQLQGVKYEITLIDRLNLKTAIAQALEERREGDETDKAFVQALREQMNEYIQQNPAGFDTPLHFVFTGVGMTVSEANKERQRVARLYEAVEMGEQHFASRIQATVERVFWHVWPAIEHVSSSRWNGDGDWYRRAATKTW